VGTTDISTTSTTFAAMTNMSITNSTSGGDALVLFNATVDHATNNTQSEYALFVDSSEQFRILSQFRQADQPEPVSLSYLVTGLSSGSHTFEIRWRSVGGSTIRQSAATWNAGRNLVVIEAGN
jgi:hypothetical protein